jgi:DNA-3-methyladenine glycosylase
MPKKASEIRSRQAQKTPRRKLRRAFYAQSARDVAQQLIGKILVRRVDGELLRARITETEAYLGPQDLASHASKGRTKRTEIMFGRPGHAYVYLIYGMYDMLNVVTGTPGEAHAVLIRGAKPLDEWKVDLGGPGRLARAFGITREHNGLDLTGDELFFVDDPTHEPRFKVTKRINIDYAGDWKHALLRFVDEDDKPRRK